MRTLFLLGILVALTIIAVKKPQQTAWDAAQGLKEQAKEVIAQAEPAVVDNLKPLSDTTAWKNVTETVNKAAKAIKETERPSSSKKEEINDTAIPAHNWEPGSRSPAVKTMPKPAASPIPDIPAMPVPPVKVVEKLSEPKIPPLPRVKPLAISNYADVQVYYEQANRFLDEIK